MKAAAAAASFSSFPFPQKWRLRELLLHAGTRTLKVRFPLALRRPPTLKLWRTPSSQKCAILRWQGSDTNLLSLADFLD